MQLNDAAALLSNPTMPRHPQLPSRCLRSLRRDTCDVRAPRDLLLVVLRLRYIKPSLSQCPARPVAATLLRLWTSYWLARFISLWKEASLV